MIVRCVPFLRVLVRSARYIQPSRGEKRATAIAVVVRKNSNTTTDRGGIGT